MLPVSSCNRTINRRNVLGLVVEGEPDAALLRDDTGLVEAIGPHAVVVERLSFLVGKAGDDQVLVA
jgi:hypothetical protein